MASGHERHKGGTMVKGELKGAFGCWKAPNHLFLKRDGVDVEDRVGKMSFRFLCSRCPISQSVTHNAIGLVAICRVGKIVGPSWDILAKFRIVVRPEHCFAGGAGMGAA